MTDIDVAGVDEHRGYVAGRYRNGSRSDGWTDVTRCAAATFVSFLPACTCGWVGADHPSSPDGHRLCQHDWATLHGAPQA